MTLLIHWHLGTLAGHQIQSRLSERSVLKYMRGSIKCRQTLKKIATPFDDELLMSPGQNKNKNQSATRVNSPSNNKSSWSGLSVNCGK